MDIRKKGVTYATHGLGSKTLEVLLFICYGSDVMYVKWMRW